LEKNIINQYKENPNKLLKKNNIFILKKKKNYCKHRCKIYSQWN